MTLGAGPATEDKGGASQVLSVVSGSGLTNPHGEEQPMEENQSDMMSNNFAKISRLGEL